MRRTTRGTRRYTMPLPRATVRPLLREWMIRTHTNSVGTGDAAVTLLKAGADNTKRDGDGILAIDLAPDREVRP